MIDVFVSLRLCVFSSILNCCIFCLSVSCTLYMTSEVPGTAWICAASLTRSQQVNQLPVIPLEKTSLKGGHSRWPQPVWPNQMASGITVHLLGIFCCHPFRCHLYDSTKDRLRSVAPGKELIADLTEPWHSWLIWLEAQRNLESKSHKKQRSGRM